MQHVWVHGWLHGWMDGVMDAWMDGWMHGWKDGWRDGWMYEWLDGCMNGWMDGRRAPDGRGTGTDREGRERAGKMMRMILMMDVDRPQTAESEGSCAACPSEPGGTGHTDTTTQTPPSKAM